MQALAKFSYQQSDNKSQLEYRNLAEIVNSEDTLQFLHGGLFCVYWSCFSVKILKVFRLCTSTLIPNNLHIGN